MKNWVRAFKGLFVAAIISQTFVCEAYAGVVQHSGPLSGHETWSANDIHQIVSTVTVPSGINLIIESGTIVKFNSGQGLTINGALDARGTNLQKIIFTSYRDDSVGGDTDADGSSEGQAGDWLQVYFSNTVTESLTYVENLIVRFAGSSNKSSVYLYDNTVTILNSEISQSGYRGLRTYNGSPTIENTRIVDNQDLGVYIQYGAALLRGNEISRNGTYGIYAQYSTPSIENNQIKDNGTWGLYHYDYRPAPVITGNTITGNLYGARLPISAVPNITDDPLNNGNNLLVPNRVNGLWILGSALSNDLILGSQSAATGEILNRYHIKNVLTINTGVTLSTVPGAIFKFAVNSGLSINGTLDAVGTAANPIAFTSEKDDALGGDMNNDGYATTAANGNWYGVSLYNAGSSASVLNHAIVRFGGSSASYDNVYLYRSDAQLTNVEASNSLRNGIRLFQSSAVMSDLHVYGNTLDGVRMESSGSPTISNSRIYANGDDGVEVTGSVNASVTGSEIFANLDFGIENAATNANTVTATNNWWGAADGPGGSGPGTGEEISSNVVISGMFGDEIQTVGTEFNYYNAGGGNSVGTLSSPTFTQGTVSTEFGTSDALSLLHHIDRVILNYSTVATNKNYDLLVSYYNPDNTSNAGTRQHLTDISGNSIHDVQTLPTAAPSIYRYPLTASSYSSGQLDLNFVLDEGFRATVAQLWLVERVNTDTTAPASTITEPVAGAKLSGEEITLRGSASDGTGSGVAMVEVGINSGSGIIWSPVTDLYPDGSWLYRLTGPVDGSYTLQSKARDRAGNIEVPAAAISILIDQTTPIAITGLTVSDTVADNGNSLDISWSLSADDGAGSNDVASYVVERRLLNGSFAEVATVPAGVAQYVDTGVITATDYEYRVSVIDEAGNRASSSIYGPVIAIDNNLADSTAPEDVTGLTGTAGNQFVYLEWTGSIDTARDLVDQRLDISVDAGISWGTNVPSYNDGNSISLGKSANSYLRSDLTNGNSYLFRIRAQDGAIPANLSVGTQTITAITPSETAYTPVPTTINTDTTWATGVYYVSNNTTIAAGTTLRINPGVIVKFANSRRLTINGTLLSEGLSGNPVVFTSFSDDIHGGDTNGDGPSAGAPGLWGYLQFSGAGSSGSRLSHSVVRYASSYGVYLSASDIEIVDSTIELGTGRGIYVSSSSPVIKNNQITDNGSDGIYATSGFAGAGSIISGNTISRNGGHGLNSNYSTPKIENNTITNNTGYGIYELNGYNIPELIGNTITGNDKPARIPASALPGSLANNTLLPNTKNQLEIVGNVIGHDVTLTPDLTYYHVSGTLTVNAGATLRLMPGVIWKTGLSNTYFNINGALTAIGNSTEKIIFTSYRDDSVGGDTNGDGYSEGVPGDWRYISFSNTVIDFITRLEHVVVRFGGNANNYSVKLNNTDMTIIDTEISQSGYRGLSISSGSPTIENSRIVDNSDLGVYVASSTALLRGNEISRNGTDGLYATSATPTLENNQIQDNGNWGINFTNNSAAPVITGNTITGNLYGARLPISAVPNITDDPLNNGNNLLVPNRVNGLWILGSALSNDLILGSQSAATGEILNRYHIKNVLTINTGVTLSTVPGAIFKFAVNSGLSINGTLDAVGTAANPIAFTSEKDDALGGDMNNDGYATTAANGNWYGVSLYNAGSSASVLNHAIVRFGGSSASYDNVYLYRSDAQLTNVEASNSLRNGIRLFQSSAVMSDLHVYGNTLDGVRMESSGSPTISNSRIYANGDDGVEVTGSVNASVTGSEIFANLDFGIENAATNANTVTATNNWWGAADGPGGSGPGTGEEISSNVVISGMFGDEIQTVGTEFNYYNAGGGNSVGTLSSPTFTQGTVSTEFGTSDALSLLHHIDRVILNYSTVATNKNYDLLVSYYNPDNTSNAGTRQHLTDISGNSIHDVQTLPTAAPSIYRYPLTASSYSSGQLDLNFVLDEGFRATVAQLWLVERVNTDTTAPASTITEPVAGAKLSGEEITLRGSASDGTGSGVAMVEVGINSGSGIIWSPVTDLYPDGSWLYRLTGPVDGSYTLQSKARDRAGNIEVPAAAISILIDQTTPIAITGLTVSDTVADNGNSLDISWSLSADDGAGSNDVASYVVERRLLNGSFAEVATVPAGVAQYVDTGVITATDYEYRVSVIDEAGNRASSSIYGPVIAIDNNLADSTAPEDVTGLTGTAGNQFVYLEWTGSIDTARDLVDQRLDISVDAGISWGTNVPSYNDGNSISLGKSANSYLRSDLTNGNSYLFRIRAQDGAIPANLSVGTQTITAITPSETAYTPVPTTINTDTTWATGVYYVSNNTTIAAGTTLRINPGVIVKFANSRRLTINGTLLSEGLSGNPVVFTSFSDDIHGGDTNGDGPSAGAPGLWGYLQFSGAGSSGSRLSHSVVRYASSYGVYLSASDIEIVDSTIELGTGRGIYVSSSSPVIKNNQITDNGSDGIYATSGFAGAGSIISGNTISRNGGHGLNSNYSTPKIENNTITNNTGYGIYELNGYNIPELIGNTITGNDKPARIPASALPGSLANNTLLPNTKNQLEIVGNVIGHDVTLTPDLTYYHVSGTLTVNAGATLRLMPGVIWKTGLSNTYFNINGALTAIGNSTEKIIFTSYRDDSVGGDTNGDGYSEGVPGDWRYISFSNTVIDFITRLEHVVVRFGGNANNYSVKLNNTDMTIIDTEISQSGYRGLSISSGSPTIENSRIVDNSDLGVYVASSTALLRGNEISRNGTDGLYATSATPTLENNQIQDNGNWGINFTNNSAAPVITGNTITGNLYGARLPISAVPNITDDPLNNGNNLLVPNRVNGLWILGSALSNDLILGSQSAATGEILNRYHIKNVLTINTGVTLSTVPGAIFKFAVNSGLSINGTLDAVGTAANPIAFTSEKDDALGGDMNNDGYATTAANGNWYGVSLYNAGSSASVLNHAIVRFGGSSASYDNVYLYRSDAQLTNVEASNSLRNGIRLFQSSAVMSDLHVYGNTLDGVRMESSGSPTISNSRIYANGDDGVEVTSSVNASVTGSEIFANLGFGIQNAAGNVNNVTASDNWWGAADGPGGSYVGSGDEITVKVDITNLLFVDDYQTDGTEFVYYNAGGNNHIGYNILTPNVTGIASSEWGTTDAETFLYDIDNKLITADFTGLSSSASYTLLVNYLNKDSSATGQKLTTSNGFVIHENKLLPNLKASLFTYQIPKQSIDNGNLNLQFTTDSNPRSVVSGFYLLKQNTSDVTPPVVQIDAPVENSIIGENGLVIAGIATDAESPIVRLEIGVQISGEPIAWHPVTSIDISGNWSYQWTPSVDGTYLLYARAIDSAGNQQLTVARNTTVDFKAPAAATNIRVEQAIAQLSVLWTLSADDGADLGGYEVYRRVGGVGDFIKLSDIAAGLNRYDDTTVALDTEYFYFVRSVDQAGNVTDSNIAGPYLRDDTADTTAPEDVTAFAAQATQLNGADISAYLTWSASVNSENDLGSQRLSISIDAGVSFGTNAPDYNNGQFIDLGNSVTSHQLTGLTANTNYVFKLMVADEVPNVSTGVTASLTPTGDPSEYVSISGNIVNGSVFEAGVYVVGNSTIPAGATVTIKPGAIFKFTANRSLTINGTLLADGTAGNPVVFTAFTDDSYGGDTNGDGASSGTPGYWYQLYFSGAGSSNSRLNHTVIAWAGSNGAVSISQSEMTLTNSTIRNASNIGVRLAYTSAIIENNNIIDNGLDGVYISNYAPVIIRNNVISRNQRHGINATYVYEAPTIDGNTISDNLQYGIYFNRAENIDVITGNTITGNDVSMRIPASGFPDQTNTVAPNTNNYIEILTNTLKQDVRLASWQKDTPDEVSTYVVYGANASRITVPQYVQLIVDPGVVVKFSKNLGLDVNGALVADGTTDSKIIFTSFADDENGGDSNNNANTNAPVNGDWRGIVFNSSLYSLFSKVNHVKVIYAGSNGSGALYFNNVDVTVENSEISNSSTNGIRLYNSSSAVTGNRIWGNTFDGVRVEGASSNPSVTFNRISTNLSDGIEVLSSANTVASNNQIFLNRNFGLRNTTTNIIDASQTWWGDFDSTGPQHATNVAGTGNEISDNVTYLPYQTTAGLEITYTNLSAASGFSKGSLPDSTLTNGTLSDEWDPVNQSPDKTMAWDANTVNVDFSGLDTAKRYKLRVGYFNGDAADVYQSVTDGLDNPVHSSMLMSKTTPAQYEFSVPQTYYASGNLTLKFVHDNIATSLRGAVTEYWLMEDILEFTPPKFEAVEFNDIDGDGVLSPGDEYYFHFSEPLDTSLLVDATTDANTRLAVDGGLIYGTTNAIRWSADEMTVIVTITDGYTITGSELVTPTGIQDKFSNFSVGSHLLNIADTIAPQFTALAWIDVDLSGYLTEGDQYVFSFNEAMDDSAIVSATTQANALLRPAGGVRYGDLNTVVWSADRKQVTVDVTSGFTIKGNELVSPSSFVTDTAGNSVSGTQLLTGQDTTAPQITSLAFDDVNGDNVISIGDSYIFTFSESMNPAALSDNTTEANQNLSPAGSSYGVTNRIYWSVDITQVRVEVTSGFTVTGNELVTPSSLMVDQSGNPVNNTTLLTLVDAVAPEIVTINGSIASPVRVTADYRVIVRFNSAMDNIAGVNVSITSTGTQSPVVATNGTWTSTVYANDTYTTPAIALTSEMKGDLSVDVSAAQDTFANSLQPVNAAYQFTLQADPPTISSHPVAPSINYLMASSVLITGERDNNTSIWSGATELVTEGSGTWSANLVLAEGSNDIVIYAKDATAENSATVTVKFIVDSIQPVITGVTPTNASVLNGAVNAIVGTYAETGSGLDINNSSITVMRNGVLVTGQLTSGPAQFTFVPDIEFTEGDYTVTAQLQDLVGLQSVVFNSSFSIDRTPPQPPTVDTAPAVSTINQYSFTGTKEANSAILVNGTLSVSNTAETTWSATVPLANGINTLLFTARDMAGNESVATVASMTFDDTAPGAVTITANGVGDGTQAQLSWTAYDEVANGNDIQLYTIYRSETDFTDINLATVVGTTSTGVKSYLATGLTRGTPYYFAVVAMDTLNNVNPLVTTVLVALADNVAPEEVSALTFQPSADQLIVNWTASANSANDLASYKVYVDGDAGTVVPGTQTTHTINGLTAATGYNVRITAIDNDANESTGVTVIGVTLLSNPVGLSVAPFSGLVELNWSAVTPSAYVKEYAIYASETDFTSVAALTPRLKVSGTLSTAKLAGLTNSTTYYFAVTTINSSDGEDKNVTTVSATPEQDLLGPQINSVTFNALPLNDGDTVTFAAPIAVTATDPAGISRVEFELDATPLANDANGADGYSTFWNIQDTTDAVHALKIKVYDNLENLTEISYNISVALAAPATPAITSPLNGFVTNQEDQVLVGTANKDTQVQAYLSGVPAGTPVTVDVNGQFTIPVTLLTGSNDFTVAASNRGGASVQSLPVTINLDVSIPEQPVGLSATSKEQGAISLSWLATSDTRVTGYDLYRSATSFNDISEAVKINTNLITLSRYEDVTIEDNTYYYRVVAVNELGTPSLPSTQVTAVADSVSPKAISIEYLANGNYDSATGRIAPGRVDVTITMNEELLTTPFFNITPDGGLPISVTLSKTSDTVYTGYFDVTQQTVSATAYAVLSARDMVGNRGTEIDSGSTVLFDTDGPAVTAMVLSPKAPIKTDTVNPVTVSVDLTIDQPIKAGSTFNLSYQLSAAGRVVTAVDSIVPLDDLNWRASFTLPADAGEVEVESLQFVLDTVDDLDNPGTEFKVANQFQVYQGDLPPLIAPFKLTGKALASGQVQLDWSVVDGAVQYQVYRQAPGEVLLSEYQRTTDIQLVDTTTLDGDHSYTVASVRQDNGDEAISAQSTMVTVSADSQAPVAPTALNLELVGSGIKAVWQPSVTAGELTYRLYRSSSITVTDVVGLTLVQSNIVANAEGVLGYVDTSPNETESTYVVTAVDTAGNESPVSASDYLNVDLLPVSTLKVVVVDDGNSDSYPVISWTHTGSNITGYNIYLGQGTANKLNTSGLLSVTTFTDTGYTGDERGYTVTAVDVNATESIGRYIVLPKLAATLSDTSTLKRNIMNQLEYQLVNGASETRGIQLKVDVAGHNHITPVFNMAISENRMVPVIVGGFSDLTDVSTLQTTVLITSETNEQVELIQSQDILVTNSNLVLDVQTQEVTRGTAAQVRFTLQNTSDVETEIVTAISSGTKASDEIRLILKDLDGNILSVQPILQSLGDGVLTLSSNQRTVARIAPGATFTSDYFDLPVPGTATDQVEIVLEIDKVHYKLGEPEQVEISGLQNVQSANLIDVAYTATVDSALPANSFGDQPIVITGQAIDRLSLLPIINVPVKIVIIANGFERVEEVYTDGLGNYSYTYMPLASESGVLTVSAIHPDILARPAQASFTIGRVLLSPNNLTLRVPYNFQESIDIMTATAGDATTATNLRLVYDAADQPGGSLPANVTVTMPAPITLTAKQSAKMPFVITADSSADPTGTLILKMYSDESGTTPLSTVTVNYTFSEATPALFFSPNFLETGVVHDSSTTDVITLENRGVAPLNDVSLQLLNADGITPAPAWIYISSLKTFDVMDVGQQQAVSIVAAPDINVVESRYEFKLRVASTNYPVTDINVYVVVTQSGIGSVLFKAADIYTATLDENNNPIPGLQGANIRLQHEDTLVIEPTLTTDALGEVLFSDLAAGRYRFRASAPNHEDLIGRITIKPGVTIAEEIFINYQLVTVEWSVTETTIIDKYEITLQATFETDVPAAVVVMEPGNTNLPDMEPGDVFYGELRFTNYGLVRAEHMKFNLPGEDAYFRYEFPDVLPTELTAKESIVLPYKIISLTSLNADGTGTGGGCSGYGANAGASFDYQCANGSTAGGSAGGGFSGSGSGGSCGGGGGGTSGGGIWGGSSGSSSGGTGGGESISGESCPEECPSGSCCTKGGG